MICPNFISLMCIHGSTQELQTLLDKGMGPDDDKDGVRVCDVKGSVSVHIRLVRVRVCYGVLVLCFGFLDLGEVCVCACVCFCV